MAEKGAAAKTRCRSWLPVRGSLARRLVDSMLAVTSLVFVVIMAIFLWRGYGGSESEVLEHLTEDARDVAVSAIRGDDGALRFALRSTEPHALYDLARGRFASESDPALIDGLKPFLNGALHDGIINLTASRPEDALHVAIYRVDREDGAVIGAVAHRGALTTSVGEWVLFEIVNDVIPFLLPLFLLTLGAMTVTTRHALAPVRALSRQAETLGPARLDVRLDLTAVPAEILPLVRGINDSLDRVQAGFESQRRFTANAAHELRTPLAVLKARCASVPDDTLRQALIRDVDRMARVVDQLLAVARLEARGLAPTDDLCLAGLAEALVADLYPLASQTGRTLALVAEDRPRLDRADGTALRDALRNLVENALRVTPPGEEVEIVVGPGPVLAVHDRGPGVPDADKATIFQPYNRGSGKQGGGAGLGLSISRDIVDRHGGRLAVEDRPGGGAVFRIDFRKSTP